MRYSAYSGATGATGASIVRTSSSNAGTPPINAEVNTSPMPPGRASLPVAVGCFGRTAPRPAPARGCPEGRVPLVVVDGKA